MKIGEKIKTIRKSKKITQKEFAKIINKSERMVQKYENDEVTPSIEVLKLIATAFEVPIGDLLNFNTVEIEIDKTFKDSFSQFISDKRYLLDIKKYKSKEEYDQELENLYNATIEFIEFYCYKLKNKDNK